MGLGDTPRPLTKGLCPSVLPGEGLRMAGKGGTQNDAKRSILHSFYISVILGLQLLYKLI